MTEFGSDYPADVLAAVVGQLAVDSIGERTLEVVRARSPEMVRRSEESGEDPAATSAEFMGILLNSLHANDLVWKESEHSACAFGQRRAAQGATLESLIDELAVYRRVTIELISVAIQHNPRRDELLAYAQSHLDDVNERLTAAVANGYLGRVIAKNQATTAGRRELRRGHGTPNRTRAESAKAALLLPLIGLDQLKRIPFSLRRRDAGSALKRVAKSLRRASRLAGRLGRAALPTRLRKLS